MKKFTDADRKLVVQELEKIQKVRLEQVKPSRKLYVDEGGMMYLIIGGAEDWHGISANIMNQLEANKREGAFVVVKKYKTKMDICVGQLSMLVANKDKLSKTRNGGYQLHNVLTEDGLLVEEIPELYCNQVKEILFPSHKKDLSRLKEIAKIINIEIADEISLTHSDIQAKLLLIGSYLGYRTYTPDKAKKSAYGVLGELSSEKEIPEGAIPAMSINTVKFIDVLWFDDEGFPTHGFEVEYTPDITKGLLRLYQVHKLRIKMFIIADESSRAKFKREVCKNPFNKIREEYIFKNYIELDEFFESVKQFSLVQEKFLSKAG